MRKYDLDEEYEREFYLSVFPGLENYWDRDDGAVFRKTYRNLCEQKWILRMKRERVKWDPDVVPAIEPLEIDYQRVRLVPDEEEPGKSYYTEYEEAFLDNLDEESLGRPLTMSEPAYLMIMEMMDRCKVSDEKNAAIMQQLLDAMFAWKEWRDANGEKEEEEECEMFI